jgi:hypothetical protein
MISLPAGIAQACEYTAVIDAEGVRLAYCLYHPEAQEIARALNERPYIARLCASLRRMLDTEHSGDWDGAKAGALAVLNEISPQKPE